LRITREGWKGFGLLAGINVGAALLPFVWQWLSGAKDTSLWFVIVFFPVLHLAWSVPLILVASRRGRKEYASGLKVAAALSSLLACACWVAFLTTFSSR